MTTEAHTKVLEALTDDTADAKWGSRFQGPFPETEGAIIDVLSNDQLPGHPHPITIHLFRSNRALTGGPTDRADARALITYGSGGITNPLECDWQGQLCLPCANNLRIAMKTYAVNDTEGYTVTTKSVTFGALIGVGASPSGGQDPITFTSSARAVDAGSFHEVVPFARRYFPHLVVDPVGGGRPPTPAELATITVQFDGAASLPISFQDLTADLMVHGFVIPAAATRVALIPAAPIGDLHVVHQFKLGL